MLVRADRDLKMLVLKVGVVLPGTKKCLQPSKAGETKGQVFPLYPPREHGPALLTP